MPLSDGDSILVACGDLLYREGHGSGICLGTTILKVNAEEDGEGMCASTSVLHKASAALPGGKMEVRVEAKCGRAR